MGSLTTCIVLKSFLGQGMKIPSLALVDVFENTDARALWHGSWKVSGSFDQACVYMQDVRYSPHPPPPPPPIQILSSSPIISSIQKREAENDFHF
jgi:hypothetical protein